MDIQFAKNLGAQIVYIKTTDRIKAWLQFAKTNNISHIIVGRSDVGWWRSFLQLNTLSTLVRESKEHDLVIMSYDKEQQENQVS